MSNKNRQSRQDSNVAVVEETTQAEATTTTQEPIADATTAQDTSVIPATKPEPVVVEKTYEQLLSEWDATINEIFNRKDLTPVQMKAEADKFPKPTPPAPKEKTFEEKMTEYNVECAAIMNNAALAPGQKMEALTKLIAPQKTMDEQLKDLDAKANEEVLALIARTDLGPTDKAAAMMAVSIKTNAAKEELKKKMAPPAANTAFGARGSGRYAGPYYGCKEGLLPAKINLALHNATTPLTLKEIGQLAGCDESRVSHHFDVWKNQKKAGIGPLLQQDGDKYSIKKS